MLLAPLELLARAALPLAPLPPKALLLDAPDDTLRLPMLLLLGRVAGFAAGRLTEPLPMLPPADGRVAGFVVGRFAVPLPIPPAPPGLLIPPAPNRCPMYKSVSVTSLFTIPFNLR
jgi:hypothetical protein